MAPAIGIDLGTVYSCVAVCRSGNVEVIGNDQGNRITPSCVAFTKKGKLIGESAKNEMLTNSKNTFYDAKRLIGRRFLDIPDYDKKRWPFNIVNRDKRPLFENVMKKKTELLTPEEISACVLRKMKQTAEQYLDDMVQDAVITVPAYFNDAQRQATRDAAVTAGLNVLQLLNEPTAAAIAFGLEEKLTSGQNILVFDMGGGTFDVSILTIENNVFEVKAVGGDTHLGGEDFNNKMLDYFLKEIKQKHKKDLWSDKHAINRLLVECEKAKIALSASPVANIYINSLFDEIDFRTSMTMACFESINGDFFSKAIEIVENTIKDSKLKKTDIQEIVLVGGSTRIPIVQALLQNCFNGKKPNGNIQPDEAVAYGAAVYASILSGDTSDDTNFVLLDVTPLSLGLAHRGGAFHTLIPRNSSIPLKVTSNRFSTASDNQLSVEINVYEGERRLARENNHLGKFYLTDLARAPAGKLKIEVTFEIDADGILTVHAIERTSGVESLLTVDTYKDGLGINTEKKLRDAQKYAAEDAAKLKRMNRRSPKKPVIEKPMPKMVMEKALLLFIAGENDEAFTQFTKVLDADENNAVAMEHRARIHFQRKQWAYCVIECQEILKTLDSDEIRELMEEAKGNVISNRKWFEVLEVSPNTSADDVFRAFRKLSANYSLNAKKNIKLHRTDRKKNEHSISEINGAKSEFLNRHKN